MVLNQLKVFKREYFVEKGLCTGQKFQRCLPQLDKMTIYGSFTLYKTFYCLKVEIRIAPTLPYNFIHTPV